MELYRKVQNFVQKSFLKANGRRSKHAERTVFWLEKIHPKADEAMRIAAISHDIERAFREDPLMYAKNNDDGFLNEEHLKNHQEKGAEIIADFLLKNNTDNKIVKKVKELISKHEIGGTIEQNMLKDADSISFFENATHYYIENKNRIGRKKVKEKFDWMFERISSDEAREISREWYNAGVDRL